LFPIAFFLSFDSYQPYFSAFGASHSGHTPTHFFLIHSLGPFLTRDVTPFSPIFFFPPPRNGPSLSVLCQRRPWLEKIWKSPGLQFPPAFSALRFLAPLFSPPNPCFPHFSSHVPFFLPKPTVCASPFFPRTEFFPLNYFFFLSRFHF